MRLVRFLDQANDVVGVTTAKITTYTASTIGFAASWAHWNWVAIISSAIAVMTFLLNWHYQRNKEKREMAKEMREERESEARIAEYQARIKAINEGRRL